MISVQRKNLIIAVSVFLLLFAVAEFAPSRSACAAEVKGPVQLNAGITLADNLVALTGKTVTITFSRRAVDDRHRERGKKRPCAS